MAAALNVIAPPLVLNVAGAPKVSGPLMEIAVAVVVILLERLKAPVEVVKPPVAVIMPVEFFVIVPLFVILVAPDVVKLLLMLKEVPLNVAEEAVTGLPNVVAPVAAFVCVRGPVRLTVPLKFVTPAFVTVTVVSAVESPLPRAAKSTWPAAAFTVRVEGVPPVVPSTAAKKETAPPFVVTDMLTPLLTVTGAVLAKATGPPFVVIVPPW